MLNIDSLDLSLQSGGKACLNSKDLKQFLTTGSYYNQYR